MTPSEFQAFLSESLDPRSAHGRRLLTPQRVRTPADQALAEKVSLLVGHRHGRKPLPIDNPELLPPCF